MEKTNFRELNALGLIALSGILLFAFYDQFTLSELPCPLCQLQRIGFVAVSFGLLLNVMRGPKPWHYASCIIGAIFGGIVALRQVSLHVVPHTGTYGSPFLGMQFATWAFVLFGIIVAVIAFVMCPPVQYEDKVGHLSFSRQSGLAKLAIILIVLVVAGNALSSFAECGPFECPGDPMTYWLFN